MSKTKMMAAALALGLLTAGTASAASCGHERGGPGWQGHHGRPHDRHHGGGFARLDTDGDGALSKAEFAARSERQFARADADRDGVLSVGEFAWGGQPKRDDASAVRRAERRVQVFSLVDADKDGKIALAEVKGLADKRFARLDRDGDGKLSREEFRRARHGHHGPRHHGRHGDHGHHGKDRKADAVKPEAKGK